MGIFSIDDGEDEIKVICFPKARNGKSWFEVKPTLFEGKPYLVTGRLDDRGERSIIATDVQPLEHDASDHDYVEICLSLDALKEIPQKRFLTMLKEHRGRQTVILKVDNDVETAAIALPNVRVTLSRALEDDLASLFGRGEARISASFLGDREETPVYGA